MLNDIAMTALTDVILACETFLLAGLLFRPDVAPRSPAWYWAVTLLLTGVASMLGAIDHGFFEAIGHPGHKAMAVATRATIVLASFAMLTAAAAQFLTGRWRTGVLALGVAGLAATLWTVATSDNFLAVVGYYAGVMVLLLGFSLFGLRGGKGSVAMCLGVLGTLGASALIPMGSSGFFGLGLYGTYHVLLMPAVLLMFLGGLRLRRTAAP